MISVCMATYNGAEFIKDQINSILIQLGPDDELIVSDDASTDNTIEILKSYSDKRIKIYNHNKTLNNLNKRKGYYFASSNFSNALNHANGDYIFLCDQDDIWYPNKIQTCLHFLKEYDIIKHDYSTIDSKGNLIKKRIYIKADQINRNFFHLLKDLPFRGCCTAFRKEILNNIIPLPKNCLQHDTWIGMMARFEGRNFKYINKPLIYHRIHNKNVSELHKPNSIFFQIYYRLRLLIQVILRKYKLQ